MKNLIAAGFLICRLGSGHADEAPDRVVMRVTDEVMRIVRTDKQLRSGDLLVAASVVETLIAPHFDFPRLTSEVLSQAWLSASPAQQRRLTDEVRTMLVQTLAVTLTSITDEKIVLDRSFVRPDAKEATVRCKVLSPGDESAGLEFELVRKGADWKAYEMRIGGVSLTAMYREQFAPVVRRRGIDGLISALEEKNSTAVRFVNVASAAPKEPPVPSSPAPAAAPEPAAPPPPPPPQVETVPPAAVATGSPVAKAPERDADARAVERTRANPPRRVEVSRPQAGTRQRTAATGPCVYKPVMTDEDIANCR